MKVNEELVQRAGVCTSCTRKGCEHRVQNDGVPSMYDLVQRDMVHNYLCGLFTQEGLGLETCMESLEFQSYRQLQETVDSKSCEHDDVDCTEKARKKIKEVHGVSSILEYVICKKCGRLAIE